MKTFEEYSKKVAIDVETTGFGKSDRIIEIAALTLDPSSYEPIDEYDTLINPNRDIGSRQAQAVHRITPTMVANAPTFEEIAPILARRLDGAVLIGHNIRFDIQMLRQEFARLKVRASFDAGVPICTCRESGMSLAKAVIEFGLTKQPMHRALTDARVCAELMRCTIENGIECKPAHCFVEGVVNPRTLRRGAIDPSLVIPRTISPAASPWNGNPSGMYRYVLNHVMDDGRIDADERAILDELAREFGFTEQHEREICRLHLATLTAAVERNGLIDQDDLQFLQRSRHAMRLEGEPLPQMTNLPSGSDIGVGMSVCFTGDAQQIDLQYSREYLEKVATLARLLPRPSVTKKLDLLVLADVKSSSGKATKARRYGIQMLGVERFLKTVGLHSVR